MEFPLPDISARTGFSVAALTVLQSAIIRGGGMQAQFSHPELGGMGQWSRGGMIMIGDMFNSALAARVSLACELLSELPNSAQASPSEERNVAEWWPVDFGKAGMRASQNELDYAYFPGPNRLAVRQRGAVALYDLTGLTFRGVGAQSGRVVVHTDGGPRSLEELPRIPAG
jgi:hypothetical protein